MLERAGADACRPDELPEQYGVLEGQYHLSPRRLRQFLIFDCIA